MNSRAGILRREPQSLEKCVPNIQKKSEDDNVEKTAHNSTLSYTIIRIFFGSDLK